MSDLPAGEFVLPLFPLPNLVFFPNTRIPLHIFEPRYRQMIDVALAGDRRIGMVLLRPGWEADYYGAPAVHGFGTVGVIEHAVTLEDGRYNLLLNGVARFRVVSEVEASPYRTFRVVIDAETPPPPMEAWAQREWLVELSRRYLELLPGQMDVPELATSPIESITNALVMALGLMPEEKQKLLEMSSLADRADQVGAILQQRLQTAGLLSKFRRDGDPEQN